MYELKTNTILKVTGITVNRGENDRGEYCALNLTGVIKPNNVRIRVSKFINLSDTTHAYLLEKIDEFTHHADGFQDGDDLYVRVKIAPRKDKKTGKMVQYDTMKTNVYNGKDYLEASAFVDFLDHETDKDGNDVLLFNYQDGSTKEIPVADLNTATIETQMIITSYDSNTGRIELTSGGNYPVDLVAYRDLSTGAQGSPTIGQGYKFTLAPTKGKKVESVVAQDLSWDSEAQAGGTFEPDKLIVTNVGVVKGFNLGMDADEDPLAGLL